MPRVLVLVGSERKVGWPTSGGFVQMWADEQMASEGFWLRLLALELSILGTARDKSKSHAARSRGYHISKPCSVPGHGQKRQMWAIPHVFLCQQEPERRRYTAGALIHQLAPAILNSAYDCSSLIR
jgi:hypothetical protein